MRFAGDVWLTLICSIGMSYVCIVCSVKMELQTPIEVCGTSVAVLGELKVLLQFVLISDVL